MESEKTKRIDEWKKRLAFYRLSLSDELNPELNDKRGARISRTRTWTNFAVVDQTNANDASVETTEPSEPDDHGRQPPPQVHIMRLWGEGYPYHRMFGSGNA